MPEPIFLFTGALHEGQLLSGAELMLWKCSNWCPQELQT